MIKSSRLAIASWSTFGQTALLIIAALVIAQGLAFFLVRNVMEEWQHSYVEQPAINRFADVVQQIVATPLGQRENVVRALSSSDERFWLQRDAQFGPFPRNGDLEMGLAEALKKRGIKVGDIVGFRGGGFDHFDDLQVDPRLGSDGGPRLAPGPAMGMGPVGEAGNPQGNGGIRPPDFGMPGHHMGDMVRFYVLLPSGEWLTARFAVMHSFPLLLNPIALFQVAFFIILLAGTLFWAARISRPLRILASAAQSLRPQEQFAPIPVEGPADVRAAINSFNTMALRVRELLHEKDRMLTAIGHDLRTPLASLRIRAESIEPEGEREKIVETIDEMTAMVEEILALARLGYSTEQRQLVDLSALADSMVEEFHSLGQDVVFQESPRAPVSMQVGLVRRLLRNLVDNAVKYGGKALVLVQQTADGTELIVEDEGPGIPAERLTEVLQPFTRLEHSRSRMTGGSGLGLTIADAIARSQGATLTLENRKAGGLRAVVKWPTGAAKP